MVTKAKKALLASLAAFLCVMLTVFGLSMSVSLSETAKAADETSAVAKVGSTTYETLNGAIGAAAEGNTVTLLKDTTEDVVVNKNITLDLGGMTLTGTNSGNATLTIAKGATTTVKNGSVIGTSSYYNIQNNGTATFESLTATAGNTDSSMIDNYGTLTINSGVYSGGLNVVKSEEGSTLVINGGKFTLDYSTDGYTGVIFAYGDTTITGGEFIQSVANPGKWHHPCVVLTGVVEGYIATTKITGGSFTNNSSEGIFHGVGKATSDNFEVSGGTFNKTISADYCAEGFIPSTKKNADGMYGVKEGKYVAKVGSKNYETLADAIRLAAKGKTVTLLDNIDGNFEISNNKSITLDLNGFTLNGGKGTAKAAITNYGTLTIIDSSEANTGTIKRDDSGIEGETSYYVIKNLGTMTIEQANVINNSGSKGSSLIDNIGDEKKASLTIKNGHFEQQNFIAIKNDSFAELTVIGGEIVSKQSAIQNWCDARITGGKITGQIWTDAWQESSIGKTVIDGTVEFTGEIVMDVTNDSIEPKLTINGGNLSVTNWRITKACAALGGKPAVQGGTFTNAVPAEYCADRFIPTQNADGTYGVKACVAKVGSTKYETLAEAIAAAKDGETVTLLDNITLTEQLIIGKALTIDLGGFTLTSNYSLGASGANIYAIVLKAAVTIKNGKIVADNARVIGAYGAMIMDGVTVENGIIGGHATIGLSGAGSEYVIRNSTINGAYSVAVFANNATVTIEKSNITGRGPALYHNGSNYGLRLTVTDTTLTSAECSVYISGSSSMKDKADNRNNADGYQQATFTRCTISGTNGIEVKYTNLTLNSCNISATVKTPTYEQNNNGSTASGFAVVSTDNATGGTTPAPKGTIAVSGEGNYVGAIGIGTLVKNKYEGFEDASYAVSGGKFNHAILPEYCAKGFIPQDNGDGTFGVKEGTYVAEVNGVKYETLQAAFDAAPRKAIVTLLADTRENVTITQMYITLDLNGYTINGGTVKGKPAVTVKARVTIKDSSEAKTGTIMREDTAENSGVSSHYVIDVQGDGWLTFEGGKVINDSGNKEGKGASLVRVGNDSVAKYPGLNIKGGTFTQNNFIVIKIDSGDLFLNGGTLTSANSYAIENWHRATVKGGTVNGAVSSWTYSGGLNSDLTISGGKINGNVQSVSYDGAAGKLAKVSITGGTVTGTLSHVVCNQSGEADKAKATIEVSGGTFSIDPSKYVVEESAITENADGTYGVEKAYLVRVGNTSYYTMDEAFKAQTASGEAIVMLRDYTTGSTFNSGTKHRVVDLNGHTWTYTGTDTNSAAFEINNPNATLTVKNGTIISSTIVGLIPSAVSEMDKTIIAYDNAGLVFEKVEMTSNGGSGIETNGNNTNDSVTLINSTLNVPNGFGIYFPSSGTLTINNSTINAKTMGVQVCSGELNINAGSVITVTGDSVPKAENDGAIQDGAAISIVNRPGYKGLSNIVITGGTFTAKAGNDAIKAYDWANKVESEFTKADLVAVSGGTFSSEVNKDYLAKGYRLTKTGESYGVTAKYIESTHVSLGTALSFSYKLRTLEKGETIKNAKASYRTVRGNLVEIDMTLVDGYYVFDGITPQMLDRKISVNVYVGDTVVYDVVDYSILDYLQDLLKTDLGKKATVTKQLVADLAFYGKAAMKYVGYTTTVVDKFIADNGLTQSTGDMTGVANSSGTEKVANVSVQFASQNKILIGVAESVFDDYSYTIKVNGTKIANELWQTDVVDGYRVYVSDGFAASYITDKDHYVEVEVLKNGASVQKVQCNVAGYCMKMAENAKMSELAKATYYYGVSAAKYANFKG